jgi:hypothetical protein
MRISSQRVRFPDHLLAKFPFNSIILFLSAWCLLCSSFRALSLSFHPVDASVEVQIHFYRANVECNALQDKGGVEAV